MDSVRSTYKATEHTQYSGEASLRKRWVRMKGMLLMDALPLDLSQLGDLGAQAAVPLMKLKHADVSLRRVAVGGWYW